MKQAQNPPHNPITPSVERSGQPIAPKPARSDEVETTYPETEELKRQRLAREQAERDGKSGKA